MKRYSNTAAETETNNMVSFGTGVTRILTWNVAGLRAVMKSKPKLLQSLVDKYNPLVLCLQETKLQIEHQKEFLHILPVS